MILQLNAHSGHNPADHHHHDDLEDDLDVPMGSDELFGFSAALWSAIKRFHLLTVAFVFIVFVAYVRLQRRRRRTTPVTDYAAESSMNLAIRRARALEVMQQEYDRKAQQFKELQAKKEAEERAARAAASGKEEADGTRGGHVGGPSHDLGGGGAGEGGGSGRNAGGRGNTDWTPLMGSGTVGGFRSQRCVRQGG